MNMHNQKAILCMVVLAFCHTNKDVAAQGVELGAHRTIWIPQTIPRYFPGMDWTLLNFASSIPETYALPTLSCGAEGFYSHPLDCNQFYRCIEEFGNNGYSPLLFNCAAGTIFSKELVSCILGTCSPDGVATTGVPTDRVAASIVPTYSNAILELNSQSNGFESTKCLSEGRIADPDDCGQFYDCVRGSNGHFIRSKQSCFGHAFDATLKQCVPIEMAKGCIPDRINVLRSVAVKDPKLQNICVDNENEFFCLDCKTLVLCLDRLPQIIPCKYGNACYNDTKIFRGGVCYPNSPVKCTCDNEENFRPDIYDPSKYLTCGSKGAEPLIQSCPEGLEFNEDYSSCGAPINKTCSGSGTFVVQSDCTKYQTCTYTTSGSFFRSVFTCKNNTMFNEEIGQCEDPCDWYNGNFTCENEGRFPNPEDCTTYFECIKDPFDTEKFIKIEHVCRQGYEWLPLVNAYHCVAKGITKEECVPKKPNTCKVPREWCAATTDVPTTMSPTTEPLTDPPAATTIDITTTTEPPIDSDFVCTVDRAQFWEDCNDFTGCSSDNQLERTEKQCQHYSCSNTGQQIRCEEGKVFSPDQRSCVDKLDAMLCTRSLGKDCPDGHFHVGSQCFFIPEEGFKTWYSAQALCIDQGGFLAEPESIPDFQAALETETSGYGFWLGGSNRKQDGNWYWSSRGAMVGNSNSWYPGEANTFNAHEECLFLMRGMEKPLAARSCGVEHHYFICEKH